MVFDCVKINEDDTTSSSRIFVKIMMQEMMERNGIEDSCGEVQGSCGEEGL